MNRQEGDSGAAGIIIAVVLGGVLLVGIAGVAFLFLGSRLVASTTPAATPITFMPERSAESTEKVSTESTPETESSDK